MLKEVLTQYGPVSRFWFDGTVWGEPKAPNQTSFRATLWQEVYEVIRTTSPNTMLSPTRGDVCSSGHGSLYVRDGPKPNSTDTSKCQPTREDGVRFFPIEEHGVTIQEGPDGNSVAAPTYWFWHPWACAGNITGCPWECHANGSRLFEGMVNTIGHGAVLNMNAPPDRSGRMNASAAAAMRVAGAAWNATFHRHVAVENATGVGNEARCEPGIVILDLPAASRRFDYIISMEDLAEGQRIANYSVELQRDGETKWEPLVPVVWKKKRPRKTLAAKDHPDGPVPRDSYIGHKRIDVPEWPDEEAAARRVRFNCMRSIKGRAVKLRSFSLHKRDVPWEE